jgi:large conductance mechanosensitive channel
VLKGFKDFIMRGSLVELAVAFIMATAFAAVVTATVTLVMDLIGKVGGTPDFSSWNPGGVSVGAWITAVISFVILAVVVYFLIVTPYNELQKRRLRGEEEPEAPAEDIALLTEIRDILAAQRGAGATGTPPRDL